MVAYSFNKRFVDPIRAGIHHVVFTACVPKRQTIRAIGKRSHARPGETLQLYHGMRTKQCFKIGEARCTRVLPIRIFPGCPPETIVIAIIGETPVRTVDEFAQADGFKDAADMQHFWWDNHGFRPFEGVLIEWEPL